MSAKTDNLFDPATRSRLSWSDRGGFLRELALGRLRREFASYVPRHDPSPKAWVALSAVLSAFEEALNWQLEEKVYLSSLDCGVGKSSAVVAFIDALLSRHEYDESGVIVCVSRLEEIRSFVQRAGIPDDRFSVFTSDPELNALGRGKENSTTAQVLFTTHAMVERVCQNGRSFASVDEFKFLGRTRPLRIWDEALSFGKPVTLSASDIAALERRFLTYPVIRTTLERIVGELRLAPDGTLYDIPSLDSLMDINDLARVLSNQEEDRRVAMSLWSLSGRSVSVRKDGTLGNTAIDYEEALPADIKPIICLDASGRVKTSYAAWEESRGDLIRLPTAPKDYSALNCLVWSRGGSKSAFADNEQVLCEGVALAINERPGNILVVTHKPRPGRFDIERTVRAMVKGDQDRIKFITWGNHTSTNEHANCHFVILAGTLFYRTSLIEGLARAAKGLTSSKGKIPREELREIELGEARHNILQAAARGAIRRCVGDKCPPAQLLIIASDRSGIPATLPDIFPGCSVKPWAPKVREPEGLAKQAVEYLTEWVSDFSNEEDFLPFKEVQRRIGVPDWQIFRRQVRDNEAFRDATANLGLCESPKKAGGLYPKGWKRRDFAAAFNVEN